ncbi:MmgE/PrpD family protein [Saccharomonospora sp. NPDC006951]
METTTKWPAELAGMSWAGLSPTERETGILLLRDALGIASAGTAATGIRQSLHAMRDQGSGSVPVPWTGLRLPPAQAALACSALIHAWDFDDTHDDAVVHTMAVALPAALAAGIHTRRAGSDILDGLIAGIQVLARLSLAIGPQPGMVRTAGLGSVAAAAAAARTMGLGAEGIGNAMALALPAAGSPHSRQVVADSAVNKRLQPGLAVQSGLTAAFLAHSGIEGPAGWADGEYGLLAAVGPGAATTLREPGWEGARLSLKPYPACRYTHAAITAAARALAGLSPGTVSSITVHVPEGAAYALVSRPFERRGRPVIDAQFSIPWLVAAQLVTGKVDLTTIAGPDLLDERIEQAVALVTVHQDQRSTATMAPATVHVHTTGGAVSSATAPMTGSPLHPLGDDALAAKTAACATVGGHDPAVVVSAIDTLTSRFAELTSAEVATSIAALGR